MYQKPINGDAKAYYAYLPAIFIYQDAEYNFVDDYEEKYYPADQRKNFLNTTENGRTVNKTFPGVAVLYLPFFLIAHFLASISGTEADGYSMIYQYLFDFGYWFYILIGAIYYLKVFRLLKFKDTYIYFSLFVLIVGTNVLFYSMVDQSVTHLFNFAMINGLIYHLLKYKQDSRLKHIYYSIALLLLIGITRPTNILVVLLIPIFIPDKKFYISYFASIFTFKRFFSIIGIVIIIGSIPFILWQWQTGNWIVYGYGDEGFDFSNPEVINFLFSYKKGWFVYTPITLVSLSLGLFYVFKKNIFKTFNIILFYVLSVYIFSSWWCWYYGAGMGQRVMIDYFILLGYLTIMFLHNAPNLIKKMVGVFYLLLVCINCVQTYQIATGIYPLGSPTKEIYWDNFLSLTKTARVYQKVDWKLIESVNVSLNPKLNHIVKGIPKIENEQFVLQTSEWETYSPTFKVDLGKPVQSVVIKLSAYAHNSIDNSRLVITPIEENTKQKVSYLNSYLYEGETVEMEFLIDFSEPTQGFEAYFWNAGTNEKVDYFDIVIENYEK